MLNKHSIKQVNSDAILTNENSYSSRERSIPTIEILPQKARSYLFNRYDVNYVINLQKSCLPKFLHFSREEFFETIRRQISLGISVNDKFVGSIFVFFKDNSLYLHNLQIDPDFRKRKIGSYLLDLAIFIGFSNFTKFYSVKYLSFSDESFSFLEKKNFKKVEEINIDEHPFSVMELLVGYS